MKVYVFKGNGSSHGFTQDASGANFPASNGPWAFLKELDMNDGETPRVAVNTAEALGNIRQHGYHIQ